MAEESSQTIKVREIFSILTQGIQITCYKVHHITRKSVVIGKILWLDADIFRICTDSQRPSIADRVAGKIPPGIYLRDISEVRAGIDTFHFKCHTAKPEDADCCLSLVGSECTISMQYPSKFTRDWFMTRFEYLVEDIASEDERKTRKYKTSITWEVKPSDLDVSNHMRNILSKGVQVNSHRRDGKILPAALSFEPSSSQLILQTPKRNFLNMISIESLRVDLGDIAEIRLGCHSIGFVKTKSTSLHQVTMSIISTEWVFDLAFVNEATRNVFSEKLFTFVMTLRPQSVQRSMNSSSPFVSPMRSLNRKSNSVKLASDPVKDSENSNEIAAMDDVEMTIGDD